MSRACSRKAWPLRGSVRRLPDQPVPRHLLAF